MVSAKLEEIEPGEGGNTARSALVLIHDGGGTIFNYCLLGPFDRQVYGISNPYFRSQSKPDGGAPELAAMYADAIEEAIGTGTIILGGWSFGGMLAVEVARLLQLKKDVRVAGLILIDPICPWQPRFMDFCRARPSYRANTTSENMKKLVSASFENALDMGTVWKCPPPYDAPPAVLIRAEAGNTGTGIDEDGQRGWSHFESIRSLSVVDTPGDHFSMFSDPNLSSLTQKISAACSNLQSIDVNDGASSMPEVDI